MEMREMSEMMKDGRKQSQQSEHIVDCRLLSTWQGHERKVRLLTTSKGLASAFLRHNDTSVNSVAQQTEASQLPTVRRGIIGRKRIIWTLEQ